MKSWQGIVIHHTRSHDVPVETIRKWQTKPPLNLTDIGYHFIIRTNGILEFGRSLEKVGAHAKNPPPSRNTTHIGIALTGCFNGDPPNPKCLLFPTLSQLKTLTYLISDLIKEYHIPLEKIESHHKHCPGERFPAGLILQEISKKI